MVVLSVPVKKVNWSPVLDIFGKLTAVFVLSNCFVGVPRAYHFKNTYSPITLANISSINLVSIFMCSSPSRNPVDVRRVDPLDLVFSLSSHRQRVIY
jgi:hypothetical protein